VQLSIPPQLLGFGLPEEVQSRFDIVGFDPRGVGRSTPVECYSDADLDEMFGADPDPRTQAEFDEAVAAAAGRGEACQAQHGETLGLFTTRQTVHDMEAIRVAVGDQQLTYLGYSYGTLLGGTYAHLYPGNVRAMVLDGAIDPQPAEGDGGGGQLAGFERAFDNFTAWCDATPAECPLAPDSYHAVTEAIEQARQSPVAGDGRDATPGWVWHAVIATLYSESRWPALGTAIADLERGDPHGVFALADSYAGRQPDGTYPQNMFDVLTTVNCNDSEFRGDVEGIRAAQEELREDYPMFGAGFAVGGLECSQWPTEPDPFPYGAADGAPPIVVIGTTGDPATPYENTQRLADLLGTGVVLTYEGEGHTIYGQRQECVNQAVSAYLVDLTVPAEGTTC
jgi:pimeloyl-ACP methyl ester carboxylesterase